MRRFPILTILLIILTIAPTLPAAEKPATLRELQDGYKAAREAYMAGRTEEAYKQLRQLHERGPLSDRIEYALGTAAARLNRPAEALARLENSLIHKPRNRDARANFNLVLQNLPAEARTTTAYPQRWHSFLSPLEWFMVAALAYIAAWAMLTIGILNRGTDRQPGMLRGGLILLGLSVLLTLNFLIVRNHASLGAYVSAESGAVIRSGPGPGFKSILTLPHGARVRLESSEPEAGHYALQLPDRATGFIPMDAVILVQPNP
jgi:tetratricopeptide (TPR) repeat protein